MGQNITQYKAMAFPSGSSLGFLKFHIIFERVPSKMVQNGQKLYKMVQNGNFLPVNNKSYPSQAWQVLAKALMAVF